MRKTRIVFVILIVVLGVFFVSCEDADSISNLSEQDKIKLGQEMLMAYDYGLGGEIESGRLDFGDLLRLSLMGGEISFNFTVGEYELEDEDYDFSKTSFIEDGAKISVKQKIVITETGMDVDLEMVATGDAVFGGKITFKAIAREGENKYYINGKFI